MSENEIGEVLLGCAIKVHTVLGPGLLESAYEACLVHELAKAGLKTDNRCHPGAYQYGKDGALSYT